MPLREPTGARTFNPRVAPMPAALRFSDASDTSPQTPEWQLMRLMLQLTDEVARSLAGTSAATESARAVTTIANELGITLRPVHPGTQDADLRSYFAADVQDAAAAEQAAARLRANPAVTAAYVKPPDAMP
jgi:hypothetical protein